MLNSVVCFNCTETTLKMWSVLSSRVSINHGAGLETKESTAPVAVVAEEPLAGVRCRSIPQPRVVPYSGLSDMGQVNREAWGCEVDRANDHEITKETPPPPPPPLDAATEVYQEFVASKQKNSGAPTSPL
ncbi:hypothetical protein M758_UG132000 [Ceratodon purpureus]|nr:hypothetical protein M758_UG132000 [Ceratodon purpureus]